jgi:hypothetical protein
MRTGAEQEMDPQKLSDSLDSLHQRMDRFYAWASQLQVEHRDLMQRVRFMESRVFEAASGEHELLARLERAKHCNLR